MHNNIIEQLNICPITFFPQIIALINLFNIFSTFEKKIWYIWFVEVFPRRHY